MSSYLHDTNRHQHDPANDSEVLIEMAADLPQVVSELVGLLERRKIKPSKELSSYRFTKETVFYTYPDVVAQYLDLYHTSVELVSVTLARDKGTQGALPDLTLEITCDNSSQIEITCPRGESLDHPYKVKFRGTAADIPEYACSPAEVSRMISSMVLSPDQLSDIEDMRRNNQRIDDVNPRNPLLLSSFVSLLEDKSDDFSSSQTYTITAPRLGDDNLTAPTIKLVADQYANGASAYDISARMDYTDPDLSQRATLKAKLEVCSDGSLNSIDVQGKQTQREFDQTKRQDLQANVVMPSIIALVSQATEGVKQARL